MAKQQGDQVEVAGPELFFGIVAPVGAESREVARLLSQALAEVGYEPKVIHLVEFLHDFERWKDLPHNDVYERYSTHMTAGNEFREALKREAPSHC